MSLAAEQAPVMGVGDSTVEITDTGVYAAWTSAVRSKPPLLAKSPYHLIVRHVYFNWQEELVLKTTSRNLDRLVNVAMRPHGMPREDIGRLYDLCAGEDPVTFSVVADLAAMPGATIGIVTGAADSQRFPKGENDGPPGAAALARGLKETGFDVAILTEEACVPGVEGMCEVLGVDVPVRTLPMERETPEHGRIANSIDAAIFIEKLGVNEKGVQHSVMGASREGMRAFVDPIADALSAAGKLTVGIGDGGNEIGFGNVYDAARQLLTNGTSCACSCGGGIITVTKVRHMYPVAISNWGAYALVGMLAVKFERPDIVVTPDEEHRILSRCIDLDLVDGGTGRVGYRLDGVAGAASTACVTIIREIVQQSLTTVKRHF